MRCREHKDTRGPYGDSVNRMTDSQSTDPWMTARASRSSSLVVAVLVLATPACESIPEDGSYWSNRRKDLTDLAHVDTTELAFGGCLYVGPLTLGAHGIGGIPHKVPGVRTKFGLGGEVTTLVFSDSASTGIIVPLSREHRIVDRARAREVDWDRERYRLDDDPLYLRHDPGWASIGLDAGFIYGFGVHFDPWETLDFVLGIVGLDLVGDDAQPETVTAPPASIPESTIQEPSSP
jgi:hypothetical protein